MFVVQFNATVVHSVEIHIQVKWSPASAWIPKWRQSQFTKQKNVLSKWKTWEDSTIQNNANLKLRSKDINSSCTQLDIPNGDVEHAIMQKLVMEKHTSCGMSIQLRILLRNQWTSINTTRLLQGNIASHLLLQKRDQTSRLTNAKNIANLWTEMEASKDIGGRRTEEVTADAASLLTTWLLTGLMLICIA